MNFGLGVSAASCSLLLGGVLFIFKGETVTTSNVNLAWWTWDGLTLGALKVHTALKLIT